MTEPRDPELPPPDHDETAADPTDVGADTQRFRAFVQREEREEARVARGGTSSAYRLWTLVGGLVLFLLIVWVLLR